MNTFESQRQQESLKTRSWQDLSSLSSSRHVMVPKNPNQKNNSKRFLQTKFDENDLVGPPAVTVVLEGRSICQRISLHKHGSYHSLAKALRQMFVDVASPEEDTSDQLDLSNAVPGHLIAYEDMENDLLLAGDLNWKDFVRVAKRIRILPVKGNARKGRTRV